MPIRVQCPGCGRQFQAADRLAGKRAKCPHCFAAISVPAGGPPQPAGATSEPRASQGVSAGGASSREEAAWYVQTSDGSQHGPMSQAELERLVSGGRLDSFCRLRHQTWSQWKWAEDLFPQLRRCDEPSATGEGAGQAAAAGPAAAAPSGASTDRRPGVVTCPDCGKTVSTRASQCPHCGCPAAAFAEQAVAPRATPAGEPSVRTDEGPAATAEFESGAKPGILKRPWAMVSVVGSAAVLLVIVAAGLGAGWWLWKSHRLLSQSENEAEALLEALSAPPAPPPAPPPVSPDEIEAAMQGAAADVARRLDGEFRTAHSAKKLIEQTQISVELMQALAQGDLDAIPDALPAEPAPENAASYQSLYDSLYGECLAYLRENVLREEFTKQAVSDAARRWEKQKRALLESQLTEELQKHLGPSRPLR